MPMHHRRGDVSHPSQPTSGHLASVAAKLGSMARSRRPVLLLLDPIACTWNGRAISYGVLAVVDNVVAEGARRLTALMVSSTEPCRSCRRLRTIISACR